MEKTKKDNVSKKIFLSILLSLLPTIIFGVLGIENKMLVWIWDALIIVLFFGIYFLNKPNMKIKKIDFPYIILWVIFIFLQFASYFVPNEQLMVEKIYMVLPILYLIHFLYAMIFIKNQETKNFNLENFYKYFLYLVLISCLYNFAINYKYLLNVASITSRYINISSFFDQRNAFGQLIFFGIIANTLLLKNDSSNKKKYIIIYIILMINLLFSFSRTAIFSTLIFILLNVINIDFKKLRKIDYVLLFMIFIAVISGVIFIFNNDKIMQFLQYYVFRSDDGVTGRDVLWKASFNSLNGIHWFIGYGLGSTTKLMSIYNLTNTHNTYIELMLSGGFYMLILYALLYLRMIRNVYKIKNKNIKKIFITMYISILIYCFFEKVLLFGTGYAPFILTVFAIVIPNIYLKSEQERGKVNEKKESHT